MNESIVKTADLFIRGYKIIQYLNKTDLRKSSEFAASANLALYTYKTE